MYKSLDLCHHGILGMKWGVRRYQDRTGRLTPAGRKRLEEKVSHYSEKHRDDFVLKKGQKFDRIGVSDEKDLGSTFVSFTKSDRSTYRANWDMLAAGADEVHKMKLKALKDIKVAGSKAQVEALLEWMGENSLASEMSTRESHTERAKRAEEKRWQKELNQVLKGTKDPDRAFDEAFSMYVVRNSNLNIALTKKLQQKGYDAVVDLWDANIADCPIYMFDRSNLKTVRSSVLTQKEKDEATEWYRKKNGY